MLTCSQNLFLTTAHWFCYRRIIHKINKIHERSLRLLLKNYNDDFQDLVRSSGDISIHQRCINSLLTKVYKYIYGFSPEIINEVFETYIITSNRYGLNSIHYKANKLCNLLPENLKSSPSLTLFKNKIKFLQCFNCPFNICKNYFRTCAIVFHAVRFSPVFSPILILVWVLSRSFINYRANAHTWVNISSVK